MGSKVAWSITSFSFGIKGLISRPVDVPHLATLFPKTKAEITPFCPFGRRKMASKWLQDDCKTGQAQPIQQS